MSCLINSINIKLFAKAFHALARIAEDLYIETLSTGLVFHTVNSSKSAYACFTFQPDFFVSYKDNIHETRKVLLKTCLIAFRSIPNLEKNVEKCLFDLTDSPDYLLLKFFCKHGLVKSYKLHFVDNEIVQGNFPSSGFLCVLSASSRLIQDGIQNFSSTVEEITLTASSNKILLRNYVDDEPDPNKVVHTELTLESEEFDSFEVQKETKITFCLKELKAILNFCEGLSVPISIKCQTGGRPVTFGITGLRGMEVQFVLATLADKDRSQSVSSNGSLLRASSSRSIETKIKVSKKQFSKYEKMPISNTSSNASQENSYQSDSCTISPKTKNKFDFEDDSTSLLNTDEEIPSTPPHKKFRSMFLGLSQSTCTTIAPDPDEILVPNSDDEDF